MLSILYRNFPLTKSVSSMESIPSMRVFALMLSGMSTSLTFSLSHCFIYLNHSHGNWGSLIKSTNFFHVLILTYSLCNILSTVTNESQDNVRYLLKYFFDIDICNRSHRTWYSGAFSILESFFILSRNFTSLNVSSCFFFLFFFIY